MHLFFFLQYCFLHFWNSLLLSSFHQWMLATDSICKRHLRYTTANSFKLSANFLVHIIQPLLCWIQYTSVCSVSMPKSTVMVNKVVICEDCAAFFRSVFRWSLWLMLIYWQFYTLEWKVRRRSCLNFWQVRCVRNVLLGRGRYVVL
jgi:hypothetical protein